MEEKEVQTTGFTQNEEPTYEQLEQQIAGLKGMNNQLIMQLQQLNMSNLFKRLDYLLKVIELKSGFKDKKFVDKCEEEIISHLTLPEVPEETTEE